MKDASYSQQLQQLAEWFDSPLGHELAEHELAQLEQILPDLFGYHLLHIGLVQVSRLNASRILHKAVLAASEAQCDASGCLVGSPEQLPIQNDSIDAVILHHSLDFASEPRDVLREAERILVPEGHIIIIGFNPFSLWGMRKFLSLGSQRVPWNGHFLSASRAKDWVALLGFELRSIQHGFYKPPFLRTGLAQRFGFMERWGSRWWPILGGVYILLARKKVSTMTSIKPRWRPARSLVAGLGDAASRSYQNNGSG